VTRCLKAIFGKDAYEFRVRFERKRNKTDAVLEFIEAGEPLDPTSESAGGQLDVAAFALRLACLLMVRPRARKVLFLDEPFKNLNGEVYQDRAGGLLLDLAKEMQVQFIIVTDDHWLKIGKIVQL
jgi:DNA repair exonuclease SbcCD ATPase subunit